MITKEAIIPMEAVGPSAPRRGRFNGLITIGAAALFAVVLFAVFQKFGSEPAQPTRETVPLTMDEKLEVLVEKGLIPPEALEPAPMTMEEKLQDLVDRGLIPRQALEPAPLTMEEKLQDLVDRGLIPRQAVEPAPLTMEEKLQDLVDRGLIPRKALEPAP